MKKLYTQGEYLDHTTQLISKLVGLRQLGNTTKILINPDGSVKIRSITPKGKVADKCDIKSYRQYYGQHIRESSGSSSTSTSSSTNNNSK